MAVYPITLYAFRQDTPGTRWQQLYNATWPAYRAWYLSQGRAARPSRSEAEQALRVHLPELAPTWERLVGLAGDDPLAAAMLTQWDLPAFAPACSQLAVAGPTRALVRNYDYAPELFECVVMSTAFTGRRVLGTSDCLWGLLDGMNDDGLAVSLAFGGRRGASEGFAIPIVLRYLLETCSDVPAAVAALRRIPVAMSYNLTLTDPRQAVTVRVGPGEPAEVRPWTAATNHRWDSPEDAGHAARFRSVERLDRLRALSEPADATAQDFLRPPLRSTQFTSGFGTIYTADYRPDAGEVHYRWPGLTWTRRFDSPDDQVGVLLQDA